MRKMRDGLPSDERSTLNRMILERLRSLKTYKNARTIASYRAIDGEVSPEELHNEWRANGKCICYPRVIGSTELEFAVADSWRSYRYGYEPIGKSVPLDSIDLMVVPGVAFTRNGQRLGFGGGFYDRILAQFNGYSVGLAYPFQICEVIHTDAWDMSVDLVLTP